MHDPRVCDTDAVLHALANTTRFDRLWEGYQEFRRAVEKAAPEGLSLRDKGRTSGASRSVNSLSVMWRMDFQERHMTMTTDKNAGRQGAPVLQAYHEEV